MFSVFLAPKYKYDTCTILAVVLVNITFILIAKHDLNVTQVRQLSLN